MWTISASGSKEEARASVERQTCPSGADTNQFNRAKELVLGEIDRAATDSVSVSASGIKNEKRSYLEVRIASGTE
jgi:hypothetical protein